MPMTYPARNRFDSNGLSLVVDLTTHLGHKVLKRLRSGPRGSIASDHSAQRSLADQSEANQRCWRVRANSAFSAANSADGPSNTPVGVGPLRKSACILATSPRPNSI